MLFSRRLFILFFSIILLGGVIGIAWWIGTRPPSGGVVSQATERSTVESGGALKQENVLPVGQPEPTPIPEEPVYTVDELKNIRIFPGGSLGNPGEEPSTTMADLLGVGGPAAPASNDSSSLTIPSAPSPAPSAASSGSADDDADGLTNDQELQLGADPKNPDTDGDGLTDGEEAAQYFTDPKKFDTDGDGLTDGEEVHQWKSGPLSSDTDGDGFSDGEEVRNGYNPTGTGTL